MQKSWELTILDANIPASDLASLAVGDIDGDGNLEIVCGGGVLGDGGLFWFRPSTREQGIIAEGRWHVGLVLEDVDSDGIMEVVAADLSEPRRIAWFRYVGDRAASPWEMHLIDANVPSAGAHDLLFADIDGDGEKEMIANAIGDADPGLLAYKRNADLTSEWQRFRLHRGHFEEGLAAGDVDGDGRVEILSGPRLYRPPSRGALTGEWTPEEIAPHFREMCRCALVDITGNGMLDAVIVESEYQDGILSWFENRGSEWVEHRLRDDLVFGHSLDVKKDVHSGDTTIFVAEMAEGGWGAPRNWNARLLRLATRDRGKTWSEEQIDRGAGTHEAVMIDIDGDGELEVVGKEWRNPKVQMWRRRNERTLLRPFRHKLIDRDKPATGIEIMGTDVDGDGHPDVVCGAWWYQGPTWKRFEIPGIVQVIGAYDIDGDGRNELIAIEGEQDRDFYSSLSSRLCWLKPVDPTSGIWERHTIGEGSGDWPHGMAIAPLLPGNRLAMAIGYHNASSDGQRPELFEVPADPRQTPWPKRTLCDIAYGEEIAAVDINGDGLVDLVIGAFWLQNLGNGEFKARPICDPSFDAARVAIGDFNNDGRPDVLLGEFSLDRDRQIAPLSKLVWFENSGEYNGPWRENVVDRVRCPHSVSAADLDGDGKIEIVCGEHDPFRPYRNQSRLMVYKMADPFGKSWRRFLLDGRFEHHCGAKVIHTAPDRLGIVSHGWRDSRYVHLLEQV